MPFAPELILSPVAILFILSLQTGPRFLLIASKKTFALSFGLLKTKSMTAGGLSAVMRTGKIASLLAIIPANALNRLTVVKIETGFFPVFALWQVRTEEIAKLKT